MRTVKQYRAKLRLASDEILTLFEGVWTTDSDIGVYAESFNLDYPVDPSPSISQPTVEAAVLASDDVLVVEILEMPDPDWLQEQADAGDDGQVR